LPNIIKKSTFGFAMPGQSSFIIITILGTVFMVAGIGLIISGAVGLYSDNGYNGTSWALLWAGIGLELIGSTLFAIARRIRWHHYMQRCAHQHPSMVASVGYVGPQSTTYAYSSQAYSVQGYSGQPLSVPQSAAFGAPMSGLPSYEYVAPPISPQAPPPYEARK